MKLSKRTYGLLAIALVLILVGSIFASVINGSSGKVDVSRIRFDGGHGELSGLLYMPEDASADNPKPTIIVTHGYLNSIAVEDIPEFEQRLEEHMDLRYGNVLDAIRSTGKLETETENILKTALNELTAQFTPA